MRNALLKLQMEGTMSKPAINLSCIVIALVVFSLSGCAGGNRGKLNRVRQPTETELKQDWQNYTVYYRRNLALIYKMKNDRKIILDNSWDDYNISNLCF
jgi:hypothetical protein